MAIVKDAGGNQYDTDALYEIIPARVSSHYHEESYYGKVDEKFDFAYNDIREIENCKIGVILTPEIELEFGRMYSFILIACNTRACGFWHGDEVGFSCGPVFVKRNEVDKRTVKLLKHAD